MTKVKLLITFKRIRREFILAAYVGWTNKKMLPSCGGDSISMLIAVKLYFAVNPFSLASLRQAVMPFLLMVRIASVETFRVTHLSSSGMKNLFV